MVLVCSHNGCKQDCVRTSVNRTMFAQRVQNGIGDDLHYVCESKTRNGIGNDLHYVCKRKTGNRCSYDGCETVLVMIRTMCTKAKPANSIDSLSCTFCCFLVTANGIVLFLGDSKQDCRVYLLFLGDSKWDCAVSR